MSFLTPSCSRVCLQVVQDSIRSAPTKVGDVVWATRFTAVKECKELEVHCGTGKGEGGGGAHVTLVFCHLPPYSHVFGW